jgi:hypothetical protein
MRIMSVERLIDKGRFSSSKEWKEIEGHLEEAIRRVVWPPGSGKFILHDEPGKGRGEGNGVKPIKDACMVHLRSMGWTLENALPVAAVKQAGALDATFSLGDKFFCVEWETGNISSSHRALNKMSLGMLKGTLIGGALIVPTRAMYRYLTDRVGNLAELEPYFDLWRNVGVSEGLLLVIAVEHDAVSRDVPRIPKGTDGRAIQ